MPHVNVNTHTQKHTSRRARVASRGWHTWRSVSRVQRWSDALRNRNERSKVDAKAQRCIAAQKGGVAPNAR